jgi:thioester reductase-like protein
VVHAAASVSLALSFEALEATNVRGALEIASFVRSGAQKTLHHISTLAVLACTNTADAILDERSSLPSDVEIRGPYAQTKWVAEALLCDAVNDLTVIRPGLLTGDSSSGAGAATCPLRAFLRAASDLQCLPLADAEDLRLDVTPVDVAARAIAEVVTSRRRIPLVHVASEAGVTLADVVRALREHGRVEAISREEFLRVARERLSRDAALAFVAWAYRLLGTDAHRGADLFLHTGRRFPCRVLEAVTGAPLPVPDQRLLAQYVAEARRGSP